jgi:hypothetical protein
MNHQHRFHTLVSNVRGPADPVAIGGWPVTAAIPVGVGPGGNVPVHFEVLSYAGTLTFTVVIDPDHFPGGDELADALRAELGMITAVPRPGAENQAGASPPA